MNDVSILVGIFYHGLKVSQPFILNDFKGSCHIEVRVNVDCKTFRRDRIVRISVNY